MILGGSDPGLWEGSCDLQELTPKDSTGYPIRGALGKMEMGALVQKLLKEFKTVTAERSVKHWSL